MTSSFRRSLTDWNRLDRLQEEEIDLSEQPEPSDEMVTKAIVREGLKPVARKRQVTLRIDEDVLECFRNSGPGYQTRINQFLRAYMEAKRQREDSDDRD